MGSPKPGRRHGGFVPWGGLPDHSEPFPAGSPEWEADAEAQASTAGAAPRAFQGAGRSYGDCALPAHGGSGLSGARLESFFGFDPEAGRLEVGAGASLKSILDLVEPRGWTLPVVPGTALATAGGAFCNDVHGKNHHEKGSFSRSAERIRLIRSDGFSGWVGRAAEGAGPGLFEASAGGMGLAGFVSRLDLRLERIGSPWVMEEALPFASWDEWASLESESVAWNHCASWVDAFDPKGRGILFRAREIGAEEARGLGLAMEPSGPSGKSFPKLPFSAVFPLGVWGFNRAYEAAAKIRGRAPTAVLRRKALFPLDAIAGWNRMYGPKGFRQFQAGFPGLEELKEASKIVARSKAGSFLAVAKRMGSLPSEGIMSFASEGFSLALDFPAASDCARVFYELHAHCKACSAKVYSAKDSCAGPEVWRAGYGDAVDRLEALRDPAVTTRMWERIMGRSAPSCEFRG